MPLYRFFRGGASVENVECSAVIFVKNINKVFVEFSRVDLLLSVQKAATNSICRYRSEY